MPLYLVNKVVFHLCCQENFLQLEMMKMTGEKNKEKRGTVLSTLQIKEGSSSKFSLNIQNNLKVFGSWKYRI